MSLALAQKIRPAAESIVTPSGLSTLAPVVDRSLPPPSSEAEEILPTLFAQYSLPAADAEATKTNPAHAIQDATSTPNRPADPIPLDRTSCTSRSTSPSTAILRVSATTATALYSSPPLKCARRLYCMLLPSTRASGRAVAIEDPRIRRRAAIIEAPWRPALDPEATTMPTAESAPPTWSGNGLLGPSDVAR